MLIHLSQVRARNVLITMLTELEPPCRATSWLSKQDFLHGDLEHFGGNEMEWCGVNVEC
jgi:hypothetical protein